MLDQKRAKIRPELVNRVSINWKATDIQVTFGGIFIICEFL